MTPVVAVADRPAMAERYDEAAEAQPLTEAVQDEPMIMKEPAQYQAEAEEIVVKQVTGDVLELQPGDTIKINPLDFPRRGMSMDKVQNELGRPVEISPSVGEPPITSWTYADRVVFFEYSKVIHVVEKR
jgi:hypothetical protein